MSNNVDEGSITFDVNDTLFFKSGQGISEMISISLDPDIIVQSYGDYVQIRGLILLQGEYSRALPNTGEQNSVYGTIEKVIETENNNALFSHRFPVDITVSAERVQDLNDLLVTVDKFDYELPDRNTLKIKSAVQINGIDTEKAEIKANETLITLPQQEDQKEEVIEMEEEKEVVESKIDEALEVSGEVEETVEEVVIPEVDNSIVEEPGVVVETTNDIIETEEVIEAMSNETETEAEKQDISNEIEIQLSESESEQEEDEVEDIQFLTELFNSQDEEVYTKIRLYITQSEDTIESIAKHYEVSTLQLIKDNELSNEVLSEGELIKIPVK